MTLEEVAKEYARKQKVTIKDVKSLHGETLLYWAFIQGADWMKQNMCIPTTFEVIKSKYKVND